ncbi:LD-carboxypeptidase [Neisseriaceae bacterium JH1-16]|nr:LD-carboxypeptidase [Neisseriaceae bacterium JH1-16]
MTSSSLLRPLQRGDTLAVIAPAGPAAADQVAGVSPWLAEHGYRAELLPSCHARRHHLAGSDAMRLDDLHTAFADPRFAAVLCLRGGYGSPRLLDTIDVALIAANPKPFVGYSDITALHTLFNQQTGLVTFHGPMLTTDLLRYDEPHTVASLWAQLRGELSAGSRLTHPAGYPLTTLHGGVAQGRLAGGNLSMLCSLLGTPWALQADGAILFLEDVNEEPYRLDRLLNQLRLAGVLDRLDGVLLGDFAQTDSGKHAALDMVWQDYLLPLDIPVLAGWRAGHCTPNLTLPFGALVTLDADRQTLRLDQTLFTAETPDETRAHHHPA